MTKKTKLTKADEFFMKQHPELSVKELADAMGATQKAVKEVYVEPEHRNRQEQPDGQIEIPKPKLFEKRRGAVIMTELGSKKGDENRKSARTTPEGYFKPLGDN